MKRGKFEKEYFEGWYKNAVGSFSRKDLELSRNWFYGWLKKLNQYVPVENGKGRKVLEIGCSIGGVASLLAERGFIVTASDVSEFAIARAKKLSPHITFKAFDIQKGIPIKGKFDLILSFEVVEHLEHPEKAIQHMYEGLKKGGKVVISTPYPYPWTIDSDPTHINVKYPEEWMKIITHAEFKNVRYYKFALLPFFYKFHRRFHLIVPFHIPVPLINNPVFFIAEKQ